MAEGGVLTIGRREDGTTFDPIKTAQNVDFWVFMNVHDVLVRVDKTGTELVPGLAESWEMSEDGLTYTFKMRDAKFSDGSPITAEDAAFSILRIRDSEESLWSDSYTVVDTAEATDDKTLVVKLKTPSAPFLASLAMPGVSVLSKAAIEADEEGFGVMPVASGAFKVKDWIRGDKVVLERNPEFWEADRVKLDGVEWVSVPDDNTRMLKVQAGELDAAIFVPFSNVAELEKNPDLTVHKDKSTREDHLLINHEHGPLGTKEVRQALDFAIDKQAIVDTVTFGVGEVANSYVPRGALYYNEDNLLRPYDPEKAKQLLAEAGASDLTLDYVVEAGSAVDEQVAVLVQQQLAQAGITANIRKVDPSTSWDMLVAGEYDISKNYWTNDVIDPDQKTTFVLGHDTNMNYMTRYQNEQVKELVEQARTEMDPAKREALYEEIQVIAKDDAHWIDLYYSPYVNVSRSNIEGFYQNPLGRFFLEDTVKN
ncbi:ABC transporter substrate-binding protein [Geminicoccus roseus]|uniref:ABC transporter substrate-binding protein n=1 Tax=Geminicoccus roseus TaxID=404900 RepID=UPI003898DE59